LHILSASAEYVELSCVAIHKIIAFPVKVPASDCFFCVVVQCDICQKIFVRPCLLRSHIKLVHPTDDTVEVYNCTESGCNRTYASVRSLRRHIALIHEGQVAECPQCLRVLSTKVPATRLHAFLQHPIRRL